MARSTAKLRALGGETFSSPTSAEVIPAAHPTTVYLMGLAESSRKAVRHRLDVVAGLLQPGTDASTVDWTTVTYAEVAAVKAAVGQLIIIGVRAQL